jgi:hypothetical protein
MTSESLAWFDARSYLSLGIARSLGDARKMISTVATTMAMAELARPPSHIGLAQFHIVIDEE